MSERFDDELVRRVVLFLAEELDRRPEKLWWDAQLYDDLGVEGDAATDLLQHFAAAFAVDLTGLQLDRHFPTPGVPGPVSLASLRWWITTVLPDTPLTVSDLIRAAATKKWPVTYTPRG